MILPVIFSPSRQISFSGMDEVYTLWSLSSVGNGGMDWSGFQIGQVGSTPLHDCSAVGFLLFVLLNTSRLWGGGRTPHMRKLRKSRCTDLPFHA